MHAPSSPLHKSPVHNISAKSHSRQQEQHNLEQTTRQAVLDLKSRIHNSQRYKQAAARKAAMKLIGHRAQTAQPRRKRRHRSRNARTAGGMGTGLGNTIGSLRELDERAVTPPFPSPGSKSRVAFGKAQPMPASAFGESATKSSTVRLPRL